MQPRSSARLRAPQDDTAPAMPANAGVTISLTASVAADDPDFKWLVFAERKVSSHIQLLIEPPGESALQQSIKDSNIGMMRGEHGQQYFLIYANVRVSGECNSKRHVRLPPLREGKWVKLLKSAIVARSGSEDMLVPGDLFLLFDGGKSGNENTLTKPFTIEPPEGKARTNRLIGDKKTYIIGLEEEALRKRLRSLSSSHTLNQTETMYAICDKEVHLLEKKRKHLAGSNLGNMLFPVTLPEQSAMWQLTYKEKKAILGPNIIKVGGTGPSDTVDEKEKRTDDTVEPVFYHAWAPTFEEEIIHSFMVKSGVLDIFPGEGGLAMAALRAGVKYCGICFTDAHADHLRKHLIGQTLQAMQTEGDGLYDSQYAAFKKGSADPPTAASPKPKAKPKAGRNTGQKRKATHNKSVKTKKQKKAESTEGEGEGTESESSSPEDSED